jgi:hypothetical protein
MLEVCLSQGLDFTGYEWIVKNKSKIPKTLSIHRSVFFTAIRYEFMHVSEPLPSNCVSTKENLSLIDFPLYLHMPTAKVLGNVEEYTL